MLVITGPTACGKTARAIQCALALGGEILSADSRQIYTGMDIGTGKDLADYPPQLQPHLVDIRPAGYRYTLFEYLSDARRAIAQVRSRGHLPILCGGTGMYIESLLGGIRLPNVSPDPALRTALQDLSLEELRDRLAAIKATPLHNVTDTATPERAIRAIEIATYLRNHPDAAQAALRPDPAQAARISTRSAAIIAVDIPRDERRRLIEKRLHARLAAGLVDEVRALLDSGLSTEQLIYYGLEYRFITLHLTGKLTLAEMTDQLLIAIHQYAKRQLTWLRGMERRGWQLHWLPYDVPADTFTDAAARLLDSITEPLDVSEP